MVGRGAWIATVAAGTAMVLAAPVYLVWNTYRARPWDSRTLRVRFEGAQYEAAGYVFRYRVDNRTHRSLRLRPDAAKVIALHEPNQPEVGYAMLNTAIDVAPGDAQVIEIRLNL